MIVRAVWLLSLFCSFILTPPLAAAATSTAPIYRVALVDRFYPRDYALPPARKPEFQDALYGLVDLDKDRSREPLYHGDIVEMLLRHPQIQVIRYQLPSDRKPMEGLLHQLTKLEADINKSAVEAVLLPWESSTLISSLDSDLSPERVASYIKTLSEWGERDGVWRTTVDLISQIEKLTAKGVKVFTIAGNGGKRMVNTLSFARGVTTVGAEETELRNFISENRFVNAHGKSAYIFRRVDGADGRAQGYDLDGDGCPEVGLSKLTSYDPDRRDYPREGWRAIKGSSFAAPTALRVALVGGTASGICLGY
ncbi:MAG: hypothetical protein ACPG4N_03715 [Gammaproteobacteria bacterium]